MNRHWYDQLTDVCTKGCAYYSEEKWFDGTSEPVCHRWGYRLDKRNGIAKECDDFKTEQQVREERERALLLSKHRRWK